MIKIAVFNKKGGVSKTTTTINMAQYFIRRHNFRVLMVDLDDQPSLSNTYGVSDSPKTVNNIFIDNTDKNTPKIELEPYKVRDNLYIIPSCVNFASAPARIINVWGRENILKNALSELDGQFDICLIDCPPSLNIIAVNALFAANYVLIPVIPAQRTIEGLEVTLDLVKNIQKQKLSKVEILGILITKFDPLRKTSQATIEELTSGEYSKYLLNQKIRLCEAVPKAEGLNQSLFESFRTSTAANDYDHLGREIFDKIIK